MYRLVALAIAMVVCITLGHCFSLAAQPRRTPPQPSEEGPPRGAVASNPAGSAELPAAAKMQLDHIVLKEREATVTVDPTRHCVYVMNKHASRRDGAVRVELERGATFEVAASGAAYLSSHTGRDADPFPGVVLFYGDDAEDGYATRYTVLQSGESVRFTTPWRIHPKEKVFLSAFFLDNWPESENRGKYVLTITQQGDARRLPAEGKLSRGPAETIDDPMPREIR